MRTSLEDLDEDAAQAEAHRRPEQRIGDDAGIGLGDPRHHRLDQGAGDGRGGGNRGGGDHAAIGLAHRGLAGTAQAHAAVIALVEKTRRFCLDRDRRGELLPRRHGLILGRGESGIDHGDAAFDQRLSRASENPIAPPLRARAASAVSAPSTRAR